MFSLVVSTYNDKKGLELLLESAFLSETLPSEIIVVDSCSTDGTSEYIDQNAKKKAKKIGIELVHINQKLTIGEARNLGVEKANNANVLISDTYCLLDKKWAGLIVEKLENGYEFVGGRYSVIGDTCAQKGYGILIENKSTIFNPSSRSIGFKKKAFFEIGKYPKEHNQGEDTQFNINIINSGRKYIQVPKAFVSWYGRDSFKSLYQQYKRYGIGDFQYKIFKKKFLIIPFLHPISNLLLLFIPFAIYAVLTSLKLFFLKKLTPCSLAARIVIDYGTVGAMNHYMLKRKK